MAKSEVSDAVVQTAIDAVLDLAYESFRGPDGRATHRQHDAREGVRDGLGGYDAGCPLCRVVGSHPQVSDPAREKVFRAALEAGLAKVLAENADLSRQVMAMVRAIDGIRGALPNPEELRMFADLCDYNPELQGQLRKWAVTCELLAEAKEQARG